jgi:hypothetical protein
MSFTNKGRAGNEPVIRAWQGGYHENDGFDGAKSQLISLSGHATSPRLSFPPACGRKKMGCVVGEERD